ncbi:uncharacterized protein B0H18DRAFT_1215471 [Fomitopsis serialis]|uniref:uncharacterized protein n=1 Tax=Fomitopsis serialis TaxID=139415 RepID=UPI0020075C6A|nr:uncharacterized protein B0H18DRAFT_1215471 [Neoantrodia serialis]KAH9915522.1 hypothetical protein B0H18DRAFT_1215471 [Neoantrodia serialis]
MGCVKWPEEEVYWEDASSESDDDANEDMAVGVDLNEYPHVYHYLPGPISPEDWSRFVYYAKFIQVLRYPTEETVDSSVFLFLQQHSHGNPLFPRLRELIWEHATPELVSVISPSIRILHLPDDTAEEENASHQREYGYRMRRHAFKQLIPAVLQGLPNLEELSLRALGHEFFWFPFTSTPNGCFVNQNIRILHIVESSRTTMKAVLAAVSTILNLSELDIAVYDSYAEAAIAQRSYGNGAALVEAIAAPDLEDITLRTVDVSLLPDREYRAMAETALSAVFDRLRRRNATSLRVFSLILDLNVSVFPCGTAADMPFPSLARSLLEIRHLHGITVCQGSQGTEASPDFLQLIARECPQLESLEVKRLLKDFVDLLPPASRDESAGSDARRTSALRQLRTSLPCAILAADITRVARFLAALFPQLEPGQCSLKCFPDCTRFEVGTFSTPESPDVLKEVSRLQQARWNV